MELRVTTRQWLLVYSNCRVRVGATTKISMKKLFSPVLKVGGLEITDCAIRFLRLDDNGIKQAQTQLPPGVVVGGKIEDSRQLAIVLENLHRDIGGAIKSIPVILSLPAAGVATQTFSIPAVSESQAKKAIELNLQVAAPVDVRISYYDYQLIGESKPGQREWLAAFAAAAAVDEWIAILKKANFSVMAAEFPAFSLTRLIKEFGANLKSNTPYLAVYLTADGCDLMIVKDGNLCFNYFRSWQSLQEEIAGRKITARDVQNFLAAHLKQVINLYSDRWGSVVSEAVVIDAPINKEIIQTLKDNFGLETQVLNLGQFGQISSLWYGALGAAIRGKVPRFRDQSINLAAGAKKEFYREMTLAFVKNWRTAIAAVLIFMILSLGVADFLLYRASRDVEKKLAEPSLAPLNEVQELQDNARRFNQLVEFAGNARELSVPWSTFLDKIRMLAGQKVTINRLSIDTSLSALLAGEAVSDSAVIAFKNAMEKEENFTDVILPLSDIKANPDGTVAFNLNFKITSLK